MKSRKYRAGLKVLLLLVFTLGLLACSTAAVSAKDDPQLLTDTLWAGSDSYGPAYFDTNEDMMDAELISVTSSDPAVIKVLIPDQPYSIYDFMLKPLSPGTSTITVKYRQDRVTKTGSGLFTVKAFPAFIQSLEVDGSPLDLMKHKNSYYLYNYTGTAPTIKMDLSSDWSLVDYTAFKVDSSYDTENISLETIIFRDGQTFNFEKKWDALKMLLTFQNSDKDVFEYIISIDRGKQTNTDGNYPDNSKYFAAEGYSLYGSTGNTVSLTPSTMMDRFINQPDLSGYEVKWYQIKRNQDGYDKEYVKSGEEIEVKVPNDESGVATYGFEVWKDGARDEDFVTDPWQYTDGFAVNPWITVYNTDAVDDPSSPVIQRVRLTVEPLQVGTRLSDLQVTGDARYDVTPIIFGKDNANYSPDTIYDPDKYYSTTVVFRVVPKSGFDIADDVVGYTPDGKLSYYGDQSKYAFDPEKDKYPNAHYFAMDTIQPLMRNIPIKFAKISGISNKTYTGSALKQPLKLKFFGSTLDEGDDYTVAYSGNKNAGTATITITGIDRYSGTVKKTFTISKAANTMTVKPKKATVKYSKLKKKAQTLAVGKVFAVSKAQGKPSYKLLSVTKSKFKKYFKVNASTGKVTIKKGLKKGTYKLKVKVSAPGNTNYKAGSKTVTFSIIVK